MFGPFRSNAGQLVAEAVLEAFGDLLPGRFEDLVIPLKVVATDFYGWRERVFSSGPLIDAVAASMAIPFLFRPVIVDGRPMVDGGVVNPLPFEHAVVEGGFTVAVDLVLRHVGEPLRIPRRLESLVGSALVQMHAITDEKLKRIQPEILIEPPIEQFGPLEFGKVIQIIEAASPIRAELCRRIEALIRT